MCFYSANKCTFTELLGGMILQISPFAKMTRELNEIIGFIEKKGLLSCTENGMQSERGNCLHGNVKVRQISYTSKGKGLRECSF